MPSCINLALRLSFFYALLFPFVLFSQELHNDIQSIASTSIKRYTVSDGLPQSTVNSMVVDKRGRIWIATQDGAAYYNVRNWMPLNMPGKGNSNYVLSIYCADDSALYFGTLDGSIFSWKNDTWTTILDSVNRINKNIWDLAEMTNPDGTRSLLIATSVGLFEYNFSVLRKIPALFPVAKNLIIHKIQRGYANDFWFASNEGLLLLRNGQLTNAGYPSRINSHIFYSIYLDEDSSLWCGGDDVLARYSHGAWTAHPLHSKDTYNPIRTILRGSDGTYWVGCQNFLIRFADDTLQGLQQTFISNDIKPVYAIAEYPRGVMWFGALTGLFRYVQSSWNYLDNKYFPGSAAIYSIYQNSKGDFYFGSLHGLHTYRNGVWKKYDVSNGLRSNIIYTITEGPNGEMWFGTDGGGVNVLSGSSWRYITTEDGLPSDHIHSFYKDVSGSIWISTSTGAGRYRDGLITKFDVSTGFPFGDVAGVTDGPGGSVWLASSEGITQLKNGVLTTMEIPNGVPWGSFQCIYTAADGSIWCGTSGNGVLLFNPSTSRWQCYNDTSQTSISNNLVYGIREDAMHRLYFLTNKGVTRFTRTQPKGEEEQFISEHFTGDDGIVNNEGNIGALFTDNQQRIWIGTIDGVSFLQPTIEEPDSQQKHVVIENISVKNMPQGIRLHNNVTLNHDQNGISFEFSLLSYFKELENVYQVQLIGLDDHPSAWTKNYRKEYTNLSEGSYRFLVWGKEFQGVVSGPAEFQFTILPPFWKTWWFRLMVFVVIITVVLLAIRFYTSQQIKKKTEKIERQRYIDRERMRISQDMHDEIGSSLTKISLLSEMVRGGVEGTESGGIRPEVFDKVSSIGDISRSTIDSINEIIWSINPRYDNMESLIQYMSKLANELLTLKNIQCEVSLPNEIPDLAFSPEFRRNVFLIFKEGLYNVIKHSRATMVTIVIQADRNLLRFDIRDNGVGIHKPTSGHRSNRMGLDNMRKRAEAVQGEIVIESSEAAGTHIGFTVTELQRHLI
ncbi:MAG: histidine kinase [Bacteroidetes bacterium]|nr:histidine kinase [Bacteroidota bacterium]